MRDYQRQKKNKYILPKEVYHQILWKIRDYNRLKKELSDILQKTNSEECYGKGNLPGDPVLSMVIKREKYFKDISIIDNCLSQIPFEYRKGVWENIIEYKSYPLNAGRSTYGRYKAKFIFLVAESLDYI